MALPGLRVTVALHFRRGAASLPPAAQLVDRGPRALNALRAVEEPGDPVAAPGCKSREREVVARIRLCEHA